MSFTDINEWIVGETDIFLAPQGVLGTKDADCNLRQRSRTVSSSIWRSATWTLRIISLAFAMILLIAGSVSAGSITVNGAIDGTTVSPGASMLVAVADGPGHATDWIGVCNSVDDVTPGLDQCDGAVDRQGIQYLRAAQPAAGHHSDQGDAACPSLWRDGRARAQNHRCLRLQASQKARPGDGESTLHRDHLGSRLQIARPGSHAVRDTRSGR